MIVEWATSVCRIGVTLLAMLMLTQTAPAQAKSILSASHEAKIEQDPDWGGDEQAEKAGDDMAEPVHPATAEPLAVKEEIKDSFIQ